MLLGGCAATTMFFFGVVDLDDGPWWSSSDRSKKPTVFLPLHLHSDLFLWTLFSINSSSR